MAPRGPRSRRCPRCAPRASGDGPSHPRQHHRRTRCSPRERGWPPIRAQRRHRRPVLPARAGMAPSERPGLRPSSRAPRASGDGPVDALAALRKMRCSPRERGWPPGPVRPPARPRVLPARAGMAPLPRRVRQLPFRAPRASGDGPRSRSASTTSAMCSPRERGWPLLVDPGVLLDLVLPARAGMALNLPSSTLGRTRAPRASGDGPATGRIVPMHSRCSPRERGWPVRERRDDAVQGVLPARAGMAPDRGPPVRREGRAPRASGDGPLHQPARTQQAECSPRERGWPHPLGQAPRRAVVLPARAGMAPSPSPGRAWEKGAPRASGDGPAAGVSQRDLSECSPRERGWPPTLPPRRRALLVLPARAGMAPSTGNRP